MARVGLTAAIALWVLGTGDASWLDTAISTAFDPAWNVEHAPKIWGLIVTVLFLSGLGFPLPEDIPLSLAGFTTFRADRDVFQPGSFAVAFVIVTIPILLGDVIAYSLGRRYGFGLRNRFRFLARAISESRMARAQRWFDHYGAFTIFLGRQVAGVRFVTFYMAGTMRVQLKKFVFFDFLGCLVSVPVWLSLGALASHYGEEWLHSVAQKVGGGFALVALLAFALLFLVARTRKKPTHAPAPAVTLAKPE
jgi:membrane protein DedA with SNARE-associated domain